MEIKLATATSNQISQAAQMHYNLESQISDAIRGLSLGAKRLMADRISGFCAECEKES